MPALKYLKVKEHLMEEAMRPEADGRMPSVRQLMKQFGVSLATVNRALAELESEQVITRRQGIGISINRRPAAIKSFEKEPKHTLATVVIACTDYPDEGLWRKVCMMEQYCRQENIRAVNCKIHRETTVGEIADFVRSVPDCGGVILKMGPNMLTKNDLHQLKELVVPVVILESSYLYDDAPENVFAMIADPVGTGTLLAETLLRSGHRRIGYIRNEPLNEVGELTVKSVTWRLKMGKAPFGSGDVFSAGIRSWENSLEAAQTVVRQNIGAIRSREITALIFASSAGAFAALQTLTELGVKVPDEISLIGEGDRSFCLYTLPRLTVVEVDFSEMCRRAVDVATGRETPSERQIYFSPRLIERESVKKL